MRKGTRETGLFQAALANSAWIDFSKITPGGVHDASEIEQVISSFAMRAEGGIVVAPHAVTWANEDIIIDLALRHHLPTHYATTASIAAGDSSPMVTTSMTPCAKRPSMSIAFFAGKNRAIFRYRCPPSSGWS